MPSRNFSSELLCLSDDQALTCLPECQPRDPDWKSTFLGQAEVRSEVTALQLPRSLSIS